MAEEKDWVYIKASLLHHQNHMRFHIRLSRIIKLLYLHSYFIWRQCKPVQLKPILKPTQTKINFPSTKIIYLWFRNSYLKMFPASQTKPVKHFLFKKKKQCAHIFSIFSLRFPRFPYNTLWLWKIFWPFRDRWQISRCDPIRSHSKQDQISLRLQ